MKKIITALSVILAIFVLVNASVWEGAASASISNDFPETGYFAATNSFPRNTVVDITNLENGQTIRVIVASGLDNPGLLVTLSRDAAEAIGLQSSSIGRVRMNQPMDPIAFSRFTEGLTGSGDPDHDPLALIASAGTNPDLYDEYEWEEEKITLDPESYELALLPAEEKLPPEYSYIIDPLDIVIQTEPLSPSAAYIDPSLIIDAIPEYREPAETAAPAAAPVVAAAAPVAAAPISAVPVTPAPSVKFSAPLIISLEKGKYYIQVAAYSKTDSVETELARIGSSWPLAVQTAGTDDKPLYRVLVGPLNLGESGALLPRFKQSYQDAFIRLGT